MKKQINAWYAATAIAAVVLGSAGIGTLSNSIAHAQTADTGSSAPVKVVIQKYVGGVPATASSSGNMDFTMSATWNATNIGSGSGQYVLGASNMTYGTSSPYMSSTVDLSNGASFSTHEMLDGSTTASTCNGSSTPYALAGYTSGNSLSEAASAAASMSEPSFTNMQSDKYVIVWNTNCATQTGSTTPSTGTTTPTTGTTTPSTGTTTPSTGTTTPSMGTTTPSTGTTTPTTGTSTATVMILKYIDGAPATASSSSANATDFPMWAMWNDSNIGSSSGQFTLGASNITNGIPTPYASQTVDLQYGTSYSVHEMLDGNATAANCSMNRPYALVGYTMGNTLAQAQSGTPSTSTPMITNLSGNTYIIVWNKLCSSAGGGQLGGDVTGGAATSTDMLTVNSITVQNGTATADGTFGNGLKYVFHLTVPTNEPKVAMKFGDWMSTQGSSTIPAANNIRISSAQASSTATMMISAANMYSSPDLTITGDLNPSAPGKQVDILVEVAIPSSSINGSYSTTYGIRSLP